MNTNKPLMAACCCCRSKKTLKSGLDAKKFKAEIKGGKTDLFTLTNGNGMEVCITNLGCRIASIMVPDKGGKLRDVVLGYADVQGFDKDDTAMNSVVGRYANRIGNAKFTLDGKEYTLPVNNGPNCLHGGPDGWHHLVWKVEEADSKHVKFSHISPDGDAGFPGEVKAVVTYILTEDNKLDIHYEATTTAPTVLNLTNHAYFNLSGDPLKDVLDHTLQVNASQTTPTDDVQCPTGEFRDVDGGPFDFRKAKAVGKDIDADDEQIKIGVGYDHNWVLDTKGDINKLAAEVICPATGIAMDVYTTQPGVQVYTANWLDESFEGKNGLRYAKRTAICLETQHYPDSPNKPEFPTTVLRPGEKYDSRTIFAFSVK